MAKEQNFEWWQGNNGILAFDVDPATIEDALTSLSGCTVRWQVFEVIEGIPNVGVPLLSKVSPTNIDITSPSAMLFEVTLIRADTLNLFAPKTYYHEAEVEDASGKMVTVTYGNMKLHYTAIR
jgi:hypothetical protein